MVPQNDVAARATTRLCAVLRRHGWVLLYVALIVASVLLAPDDPVRFIHTGS
jgi:hypothetical protein